MQIINKHTVLKAVRTNGSWKGYIAPSKVSEFHLNNGWCLGMEIEIINVLEENGTYKPYVINSTDDLSTASTVDNFLSTFALYNCNPELGNKVRFWVI